MEDKSADISKNGFLLVSKYRAVIMGIAAIWIHVYHTWIHTIINPVTSFGKVMSSVETYFVTIGNCGVDIFLLISGMGLVFAIKKESLPTFYYRRIRRVYLPFLIAAVVSALAEKWSLLTFLQNISGYSFYVYDINTYCWFVPAVITLYICFPVYYVEFDKIKRKHFCTAGALLIWLLVGLLLNDVMREDMFGFYNRIPVFLIGILFGYLARDRKDLVFKAWHYIPIIFAFAASLFLLQLYKFEHFYIILTQEKLVIPNGLFAVSFPFLTAKLLDIIERHFPKFGKVLVKVLSFWGKISLEIYLIYTCFLVTFFSPIVLKIRSFGTPPFVINLIMFAITSVLAWILYIVCTYFWKLVEKLYNREKPADSDS